MSFTITAANVTITPPLSMERFRNTRINHAKFREIAETVFGIERPITLERRRARTFMGLHWTTLFEHSITLNSRHATVEDACRTLAHELWHCVQAESVPWRDYIKQHKQETAGYAYRDRPREVEARAAEDLFWQELLPCFTVKTKS